VQDVLTPEKIRTKKPQANFMLRNKLANGSVSKIHGKRPMTAGRQLNKASAYCVVCSSMYPDQKFV